MGITQLFDGFLQPVAVGSATVFVLLLVIHLGTPKRSAVVVTRRTSR